MIRILKSISLLLAFVFICYVLRFCSINTYEYSNSNGSFTFIAMPAKGRDLSMLEARLDRFKANGNDDTTVYRLFKKKYWKFWLWMDYSYSGYYQFPYKNWNEIQLNRGTGKNIKPIQDF